MVTGAATEVVVIGEWEFGGPLQKSGFHVLFGILFWEWVHFEI